MDAMEQKTIDKNALDRVAEQVVKNIRYNHFFFCSQNTMPPPTSSMSARTT